MDLRKLKKWKIFSIFALFGISAIIHSLYKWFPCTLTAIFFPVNESIWEHNKMIIFAFFIWMFIEYFKFKDKRAIINNLVSALCCIISVMVIFIPVFFLILKTNDNVIVTLIIYFICICISQYISYKLYKDYSLENLDKSAIVIWITLFIINAILSFYPPHLKIFYDYNEKGYGIIN